MKISKKRLRQIIKEEVYNWQGQYDDDFKFKKGIRVKDVNPDCPHYKSEGIITKVEGNKVTFEVIIPHNSEVGEKLTKTKEQLMPMAQFPFGDDHEETKEQPMGE